MRPPSITTVAGLSPVSRIARGAWIRRSWRPMLRASDRGRSCGSWGDDHRLGVADARVSQDLLRLRTACHYGDDKEVNDRARQPGLKGGETDVGCPETG